MALDEPFRLAAMMALTEWLEGITISAGYKHDLAGAVFRGRMLFGKDDPVPMVSILENPIAQERLPPPDKSRTDSGPWDLMVQGFAIDDRANPTDPAYRLLADVQRRLSELKQERDSATGILGLGKKAPMIDTIVLSAGVVRPPDEISEKAYFWLAFTLGLVEDHANPYNE